MEAQPRQLTPEDQLGAIQDFINVTSTATANQLYWSHFTAMFNPKKAAQDQRRILADVDANLQTLNNLYDDSRPNLQIVHEKLAYPAQIITFLGFDFESTSYNVGGITHEQHRVVWQLTSTSQIQLAK